MAISDLPEPIKADILSEDFQDRDPARFYLTELLGCSRKAYMRIAAPLPTSIEARWWMYRGNVFDKLWTPKFKRNQVRVTYRVPRSKLIISGKFDFEDIDGTITDLKTIADTHYIKAGEAKDAHKKQVMFYAYLDGKNAGRIYYISFKDAIRCDFTFTDEEAEGLLDYLSAKAKLLYQSILDNKAPKGNGDAWECDYCEYATTCPTRILTPTVSRPRRKSY